MLNAVQLWHDNSGKSPDWFCSKILVYDLEEKTQYIFLVNQWLALEVNDYPDALIPPATSDEVLNVKRLFVENSVLGMRENHMHLSVFVRHPRSPVSRKERLAVLMVLLMSAMLASILLFKITDKFDESVDDYEYSYGKRELIVSLETVIISTIFAFIAMFLFRKSYKRKIYRQKSTLFMPQKRKTDDVSVFYEARKPAFIDLNTFEACTEKLPKQRKDMSFYETMIKSIRNMAHQKALRPVHLAKYNQHLEVKRRWLIMAWVFSILVILISTILVMLYSLKFGEKKSLKWLSIIVVTQIQDIFLFTPLKIIIIAMLLSTALERATDAPSFQVDVDKAIRRDLMGDKAVLQALVIKREQKIYYPLEDKVKAKMRRKRIRILKWKILVDFIVVLAFILLLCYIMRQLWSGSQYHPNVHAVDIVNRATDGQWTTLDEIYDKPQFTSYLRNTILRSLFNYRWYNSLKYEKLSGEEDTFRRKDWTRDYVSRLMGAPRLRQLRVVKSNCRINKMMYNYVDECIRPWSITYMEKAAYGIKWQEASWDDLQRESSAWRYTDVNDLSVFPLPGKTGTSYPSGGYILPLHTKRAETKNHMTAIDEDSWIDVRTRAILLELTLYNVNNYLFSQVTVIVEHLPYGMYLVAKKVESVHIREELNVWNVMYIVFIVILCIRILYKMNRYGFVNFMKKYINIYEIMVIITGVASVICYLVHLKVASYYVGEFERARLDVFFHFKEIIKYFLYTKILLWMLFLLLVFRLFVSWYFGKSYVYFYHTFVMAKRWDITLILLFLLFFFVIWRFVGYVLCTFLFYNYRVNILHKRSYNYVVTEEFTQRSKILTVIICLMVAFFNMLYIVMYTHYYRIGKRKKLTPMQHYNFKTFIVFQIGIWTGKKVEKPTTDRIIHRRRDTIIPRSYR